MLGPYYLSSEEAFKVKACFYNTQIKLGLNLQTTIAQPSVLW